MLLQYLTQYILGPPVLIN